VETLLRVGLSNALASSVLALAALAAGRLCRRPAVVHCLWLLVLLKLVTPPLLDVRIPQPGGDNLWVPAKAADPSARVELIIEVPQDAGLELAPADLVDPPPGVPDDELPTSRVQDQSARPFVLPLTWQEGLVGVWLLGSLAWFVVAGKRVRQFRRLLEHGWAAPMPVRDRVRDLSRQLGLRRVPEVILLPGRLAPLVWCVGGRTLLCLPAGLMGALEGAALDTLLVHELAHLRRRDHWVRALEFVTLGLYWWHPVAWFARHELREAEEQCCDAWVVALLPSARHTYAEALVDTLDFLCGDPTAVPALASGIGPISDLKRRLSMILRGTTPRGLGLSGLLWVLGLAALLPMWPRWAEAQQPAAPGEDARRLETELRRLEAELQEKMAELRKLEVQLRREAARERDKQAAQKEKELYARKLGQAQKALAEDAAKEKAQAEKAMAEAAKAKLKAFVDAGAVKEEVLKQAEKIKAEALAQATKAKHKALAEAAAAKEQALELAERAKAEALEHATKAKLKALAEAGVVKQEALEQAEKAIAEAVKVRTQVITKTEKGLRGQEGGNKTVVIIELRGDGEMAGKLKEVIGKLKQALPEGISMDVLDGREVRVRVTGPTPPKAPSAPRAPESPAPPSRVRVPAPPAPRGGDVERRLEELQRQLEMLRREIQQSESRSRRAPPERPGP
jgi:beta-lactamase regulating signal transducer with metallopeptidase domain